jgi:hypothetical protein
MGFVSFFSIYDTPKFVRVESARLGFLWWGLALAVVVYSCSSVFVFRSFRSLEPLHAFVDITVKQDKNRVASCDNEHEKDCRVVSAQEVVVHREMRSVAIGLTEKKNHTKARQGQK